MLSKLRRLLLPGYFIFASFFLAACTIPGTNLQLGLPSLPDWIPLIGGKGTRGPVTLTYWGLWEPLAVIQPLIDEYRSQNPDVTVVYENRDPRQHFQTVQARLKTDTPPDIIRVHSTWVPFLAADLSPLSEKVMSAAEYEQAFFPVTQLLKQQGQYYGLSLGVDGLALVYNEELLQQAGINSPPRNWNELRNYVRQLTQKDKDNQVIQSGVALGYSNIDYFSDILGLMFAQNGVAFETKDGQVNFHQSLAADGRNLGAEALTFYTLFATSEKAYNPAWPNSTAAFAQGKVAMILIPSHRILEILGANPQLKIGVAPAPQLPGAEFGSGRETNWANFWVEAVAKNSPHPQEAWKFLKFLAQKENLVTFYRNASQIRPFGEPFPRADLITEAQTDPLTRVYTEQGPSYKTWYFAAGAYDVNLNDAAAAVLKEMVDNISLGGKAVEGQLTAVGPKVQAILDKQRQPE